MFRYVMSLLFPTRVRVHYQISKVSNIQMYFLSLKIKAYTYKLKVTVINAGGLGSEIIIVNIMNVPWSTGLNSPSCQK